MQELAATIDLLPDPASLRALAKEHKYAYQSAAPYPHAVFDDFLRADLLDQVLAEFPTVATGKWIKYSTRFEDKFGSKDAAVWGPTTQLLLLYLNSQPFIEFLQELTGIEQPLLSDPYFEGGGLHQILPGGLLKVHADFNKHPKSKLDRRLNVLLYLNKDWDESYGGHFEMWDTKMEHCVKKVLPLFNRLVIFSTTYNSYHGHPDPLSCPEGNSRKSLALYYYSNGRPEHELHPELVEHTTLFQNRPSENIDIERESQKGEAYFRMKDIVKSLTPPILLDLYRKLR